MKNKIIFTQDVPGERGWLQRQFPAHKNFETSSSGKWTAEFPYISDQATLHEIAYSDHYDLLTLLHSDVTKIKSFYASQPELVFDDNKHWVCSDQFVSTASYSEFRDRTGFWVLHLARSGTMFIEELLSSCRVKLEPHHGVGSRSELVQVFEKAKQHPESAIVFVYRPELWETFTSTVLSHYYGYHHGDEFDWSTADPISVTIEDMLHFRDIVVATLNFWCNLRSLLPSHSMLLLNGTEMIQKYRDRVSHNRVNYNKKDLITNFEESKTQWYDLFDKDLSKMLNNGLTHLAKMNCKQNLDHLEF